MKINDLYNFQLIRVVGYDLRKKIRAQIRLVKKLITENTLESHIKNKKSTVVHIKQDTTTVNEAKKQDRRTPEKIKNQQLYNPAKQIHSKKEIHVIEYQSGDIRKTPERSEIRNQQRSEKIDRRDSNLSYTESRTSSDYITTSSIKRRSQTPEKSILKGTSTKDNIKSNKVDTNETFTKLTRNTKVIPKFPVEDEKPEWVKQRNLRKTSEIRTPITKKTITNKVITRTEVERNSPMKETKPTDLITSSYGVGPTDENGAPLFGLRALRAQNQISKGNS